MQVLNVEYDKQNAQNDNSVQYQQLRITLASAGVDLIFANSTPSAQAAASATQEIPIIFTSVTDAVSAELVASNEEPRWKCNWDVLITIRMLFQIQ